ncbi:MAG: hypothetical protein AB7E41_05110, partial [Mycolicibacterium sp.]
VDPASITSDFEFVKAPDDDPYQAVVYRYERIDLTIPVLIGAAVLVLTVAVLLGARLTRGMRRRPTVK